MKAHMHTEAHARVTGTASSEARVRVVAPASLSNLGPGFDTLGLCITGFADEIEAWRTEEPGVRIEAIEGVDLPLEATRNTAAVAAQHVLKQAGASGGVVLRIRKGIPIGSGIGGSAASAVGGAWATNLLLGTPFTREELVDAVLAGEAVASGSRHGDNVLPALFGGAVLVDPSDARRWQRIPTPEPPSIVLLLPEVEILTREARAILPGQVALRDAVRHAAELAFLLQAIQSGNWREVGYRIMQDRLVEPYRARLLPGYEAMRAAALAAGAWGCALSGSGPALFALAPEPMVAIRVTRAMEEAARKMGVRARAHTVTVHPKGVHQA